MRVHRADDAESRHEHLLTQARLDWRVERFLPLFHPEFGPPDARRQRGSAFRLARAVAARSMSFIRAIALIARTPSPANRAATDIAQEHVNGKAFNRSRGGRRSRHDAGIYCAFSRRSRTVARLLAARRNLPTGLASHSKRIFPGAFMIIRHYRSTARRAALAVLVAGIAGAAAAADEPAQTPTFSEAIAQSAHRAEWQRMIASEKRVPEWLASDNRVSSPYRREQVEGASYLVGWMCKPHDCAANQFYGVIDEDSHRVWGMLVTLPETPGAYDAPSKYASFRWFGIPDERMKAYLQDQLKQDPNWK